MSFFTRIYTNPIGIFISIFLLVVACDEGDVTVRILAYDLAADEYGFKDVTITTLDDLERMEGSTTTMIGGADIEIDYVKGQMSWNEPGYKVAFSGIKSGDVVIPEDFDSLAMASVYYNLETATLFFEQVGLPNGTLVQLDTYYWPKVNLIETTGEETEMVDNAFYLYVNSSDRGFYVFPWEDFSWLPLSMNQGVMAHEFTHAVYDAVVHDPNRSLVSSGMEEPSSNFLYGLNEGCADYMGYAVTGDPDFMEHSIEKDVFIVQCNDTMVKDIVRDVSLNLPYTNGLDAGARQKKTDVFCPYDIGAFFASMLYAIAIETDSEGAGGQPSQEARLKVAEALMGAMMALGQNLTYDFELWDMINLVVAQLDPADKDGACTVIEERYAMYYSEIGECS